LWAGGGASAGPPEPLDEDDEEEDEDDEDENERAGTVAEMEAGDDAERRKCGTRRGRAAEPKAILDPLGEEDNELDDELDEEPKPCGDRGRLRLEELEPAAGATSTSSPS
jgi:hypothetical protein